MKLLLAVATGLVLCASASSKPGTFPGKSGLIAYTKRTPPCSGAKCAESIWVSALDGSNAKRLTPVQAENQQRRHPTWSPDGTKIAYIDNTGASGTYELWVVNPNGTGRQKLATSKVFRPWPYYSNRPTWTADGKEVAFLAADTGVVLAVDTRTRRVRELLRLPRSTQAIQLSPNGKYVAFTKFHTSGSGDLFVRRLSGGGTARVARTNPFGWNDNFEWSPDSTRFAISTRLRGEPTPGIVSATGGPVRQFFDDVGRWERPVWSPDGKTILSQVQQYPEPDPNMPGRKRTHYEWDRFRAIDLTSGEFAVVGPGAGSCRVTFGPIPPPCPAYDPSWQPRK